MMLVRCDVDACQGHGLCAAAAPEVYQQDDKGYITVEIIKVPAGLEDEARYGAASCPEGALVLEDD